MKQNQFSGSEVIDIESAQIRMMSGEEGLVLQGCGGDPQEWLDGINNLLSHIGILKNGTEFAKAFRFQNEGLTNILFPFDENVDVDAGKMAIWRLQSHEQFGGTWLSDYVPNQLGGFLDKPQDTEMEMDNGI